MMRGKWQMTICSKKTVKATTNFLLDSRQQLSLCNCLVLEFKVKVYFFGLSNQRFQIAVFWYLSCYTILSFWRVLSIVVTVHCAITITHMMGSKKLATFSSSNFFSWAKSGVQKLSPPFFCYLLGWKVFTLPLLLLLLLFLLLLYYYTAFKPTEKFRLSCLDLGIVKAPLLFLNWSITNRNFQ